MRGGHTLIAMNVVIELAAQYNVMAIIRMMKAKLSCQKQLLVFTILVQYHAVARSIKELCTTNKATNLTAAANST